MKNRFGNDGMAETVLGFLLYVIPVLCAFYILAWAGRAYAEGYGLFVQKALDSPGEAHSEMVTVTEEDAGSALAVGRILKEEGLISSRLAFAVKARLTGYGGAIVPGAYILSSDMTMEEMLSKLSAEGGPDASGGEGAPGGDGAAAGELQDSIPSEKKENRDVWGQ